MMEKKTVYDVGDFETSPSDALSLVRERGEVIQITDGESEPMLLLRADKNILSRLLYEFEVLDRLRVGIADINAGRTIPAAEFFKELRKR